MLTLAECKRGVAEPNVSNVGDVARSALGEWGRRIADFFVFVVQGGVCCCLVDLVIGNVQEELGVRRELVVLAMGPLFFVMSFLRRVAQMGWLNRAGSVAMVAAVVAGTACGAHRLSTGKFLASVWPRRPVADAVMLAASIFFSFEGLSLVLPVEREMREPRAFPKVIVSASACLVTAFLALSVSCGIAFRAELETASVIAFLAVHSTGAERAVLETCDALVTAAVLLTFPLQLLPASQILSGWLGSEKEAWHRLALVAIFVCASLAVRNVALLVSLFGAVGQTGLGMLVPACHLALMRSGRLPRSKRRALANIFVLTFCALIMVCGSYMALGDIVAEYSCRAARR